MVKCNVSLCCVKTLLNRAVDLSANRFKLPIYFAVGKPQYLNSILLNDTASFVVVKLSLFCIVLKTRAYAPAESSRGANALHENLSGGHRADYVQAYSVSCFAMAESQWLAVRLSFVQPLSLLRRQLPW